MVNFVLVIYYFNFSNNLYLNNLKYLLCNIMNTLYKVYII